MPSIFMSYSRADKLFVKRLAEQLEQEGAIVWLDEWKLNIGDSLIKRISEGIDQIDFVAAVLSKNSIQSDWVTKELSLAMTKEIKCKKVVILPLLIEDCPIPDFLRDKLYADFTHPENFQEQFTKLLKAMGMRGDVYTCFSETGDLLNEETLEKILDSLLPQANKWKEYEYYSALSKELSYLGIDTCSKLIGLVNNHLQYAMKEDYRFIADALDATKKAPKESDEELSELAKENSRRTDNEVGYTHTNLVRIMLEKEFGARRKYWDLFDPDFRNY